MMWIGQLKKFIISLKRMMECDDMNLKMVWISQPKGCEIDEKRLNYNKGIFSRRIYPESVKYI